jgi:hypothetical protein
MSHDLNIDSYNLRDLLQLFDLKEHDVQGEHLKMARKKVLMMHPDKSKLDAKYFLFYKKAYDVISHMYDNVNKMTENVVKQEYFADTINHDGFRENLKKISADTFQREFNEIYEKHAKKNIDSSKNDWFTDETAMYNKHGSAKNNRDIHSMIDGIKEKEQLVLHKSVNPFMSSGGGNSLYDDADDDFNEGEQYVECNPFSKLKFEDLRKVHKDQTVLPVRESDMDRITVYKNVDDYEKTREYIKPIGRTAAENLLDEQERIMHERLRQKKYQAELTTQKNMEKNKIMISNFLKLN